MALPTYALHVECAGGAVATQIVNRGDTIFLFADEVEMQTRDGNPTTWYRIDGTVAQSNSASAYLDDGGYYIEAAGEREYFYVFAYPNYAPQDLVLEVTPLCSSTELTLSGTLPEIRYTTASGESRALARTCTISYTALAWDGGNQQWGDSAAVAEEDFRLGTYTLPALYQATDIVLTYEPLRESLGMAQDSVVTALDAPIAATAHPTTVTTVRGAAGELSNEVERPTDASVLSGSAPIDVLFRTNPSPAVEFVEWQIYQGTTRIVQRTDEEHRYTFTEPGQYRAICRVRNTDCPCADEADPDCAQDSTVIDIAVSESMLLVPNVFTPNGDGKNDEFRVLYRSLREFHCWVYNRWGKLVYEWTDPARGWDGTINGLPAAEGAYYYVIRAMGTDAATDASYMSKIRYDKLRNGESSGGSNQSAIIGIYQLSGDINLIRGNN